jgi:hypothetical protein
MRTKTAEEASRSVAPQAASRTDAVLLALSALLPAVVAAAHLGNGADAARDEGVVRVLGLGWTGGWRTLDAVVSGLFMVLPIGTRAARAELAAAAVCGVAGAAAYVIARRLSAACATAPRLGPVVAAMASLTATLSAAWQLEATSVAGATLGAVLVLLPAALIVGDHARITRLPLAALVVGLACSYEPLVGAGALAGVLPFVLGPKGRASADERLPPRMRGTVFKTAAAFVLGLVPLAWAFLRRTSMLALPGAPLDLQAEGGTPRLGGLVGFLRAEIGWIGLALVLSGVGLALATKRARPFAAALVGIAAVGVLARVLRAPFGPAQFAAPVLAGIVAAWAFAGVAMQAIVRAVARAPVPLASASAAMVVVLELTFPVLSADDALQRLDARGRSAEAIWVDAALGPLPPHPVLLLRDERLLARFLAARATGEMRGDVTIVPLSELASPLASRALALEPRLLPLWRDLLLLNGPDEFALSSLAAARPLAVPFDPRWERALARHLLPAGLVGLFEPEPRGASDRQRVLVAFAAYRDRLAGALDPVRDPELAQMTREMLFARALTLAAIGERELATGTLDEARRYGPTDRRIDELARRLAAPARGPVDVRDLLPP